jgi:DNA-binding PucR family transcriptional regulator
MATHVVTADVQEEVERVVDALQAGRAALVDAMVATIQAEVSAYANASPSVIEDVRAHCEAHSRLKLELARIDRVPRRDELAFARDAAARRVRQGVPLDSLLQAFRVGHRTVWEAIVEESDGTPYGREAAIALARPTMMYIDIASTQVAEAYLKEEQRLVATAERERRDLLENLLAGRVPDQDTARRATALDPEGDLVVAVASPDCASGQHAHALQHLADAVAAHAAPGPVEPLVVVRQREVVAVLPAADGAPDGADGLEAECRALLERRGIALRAGVSTRCAGFGEIAHAYEDARQALRRTTAGRPIMALSEMTPFEYLLASADRSTRRVVAEKGRELVALDRNGSASETLLAYVAANLSVKGAAERLYVHPNTVRYRLRRMAELTGRELRTFEELMDVVTVIRLAREEAAADQADRPTPA